MTTPPEPSSPSLSSSSSSSLSSSTPHPHVLVRWFVQYNPLFTASALCVLAGVFVVQRTFAQSAAALVPLAVVVEVYQALVIGTAALLYRRLCDHRPGVILGLIAAVFLFDPTLQGSALAETANPLVSFVWWTLFVCKFSALAWAFCLRPNVSARAIVVVVGAVIAALPQLRVTEYAGLADDVLAAGLLVMGVLASIAAPSFASTRALGEVGAVMFPRLQRAVFAIALSGLFLQGTNAMLAEGAGSFAPVLAVMALLGGAHLRDGRALMVAAALAGWISLLVTQDVALATSFVGAMLVWNGLRREEAVVVVAGLAAFALPGLVLRDLDGVTVAVVVSANVALVVFGLWRRAWSALGALTVLHGPALVRLLVPVIAATRDQWGFALLGLGFVLMPAGVVLHRRLSAKLAAAARVDVDADADSPATSAAVPR